MSSSASAAASSGSGAGGTRPPAGLRFEVDGDIGWIIADNPDRMNAFTAAMWDALPTLLRKAEADASVRVVVLRGSGTRSFSAGADISEFETSRTGDAAKVYDRLNHQAFAALSDCAKPTIAMIHGHCLGGGLGIALCCDLRLVDEPSQFAIPAAKLGIGYNPRWVRPLLATVAPPFAKEILFTGRRFTSADALRMGLVNRVVPADKLESETRALATEIANNAPMSVLAAKRAIDELTRAPEHPDTATLDALVEACFTSADYAEGRRAFLEKRKPRFTGK